MREITNNDDLIDSRDIIGRIEELEGLEDQIEEEEEQELKELLELQEEAQGSPDWQYGEALIRHDYFVKYCQDLAQDIGNLPRKLPEYIESNIDWEGVASDLQVDYMTVVFDGVDYFIRA